MPVRRLAQSTLQNTPHLSRHFSTIQRRHELLKLPLSLSCLRTNYTTPYEKLQHTTTTGRHVYPTDSRVKLGLFINSHRAEKILSKKTVIGATQKPTGPMHMFFSFLLPRHVLCCEFRSLFLLLLCFFFLGGSGQYTDIDTRLFYQITLLADRLVNVCS